MNRIPYSYNVLDLNSEPAHFFFFLENKSYLRSEQKTKKFNKTDFHTF